MALAPSIPAIKSRNHARNSVENIWLSQPQRRFRRDALLSPAEKLLASLPLRHPYSASGQAVGLGGCFARLFVPRSPALQTILHARLERREWGARSQFWLTEMEINCFI